MRLRRRMLEIPAVRNMLGLHSPSRCMTLDNFGAVFAAALEGREAPPSSCGCTCRRCRRHHQPAARPPVVDGPVVYDPPGDCEECDRRRAEWDATLVRRAKATERT